MNRARIGWLLGTGLACLAGAASLAAVSSRAQDDKQTPRAAFMRQKLELGKDLLESLSVENFGLMEKSVRGLKRMSIASEWEAPTIPNVEEFLPQTTEFQRICDEILRASQARNLDMATVGFIRLTTTCVNCHKHVRSFKLPAPQP